MYKCIFNYIKYAIQHHAFYHININLELREIKFGE